MIGYIIWNGNAGGDPTKTALGSNGTILMFKSEKAANEYISNLEWPGGLEVKDLCVSKVSIEHIPEDEDSDI